MRWPTLTMRSRMPDLRRSSVARCMIAWRSGGMRVAAAARMAASFSSSDMVLSSAFGPLVVGLAHGNDRVIGAAILALDIGALVVRQVHHREEGGPRGIADQCDVIPAMGLGHAERHRLGLAGPYDRAADALDQLDAERAVAEISVPAAALAVARAVAETHQVQHRHRPVVGQRLQIVAVEMVDHW